METELLQKRFKKYKEIEKRYKLIFIFYYIMSLNLAKARRYFDLSWIYLYLRIDLSL